MPAIRFPASAVSLLPLCKGHSNDYIFKTYADLIGFLAAYGYHLEETGWKAKPCPEFTEVINPIAIEVFENRELYVNFLMVAIARSGASDSANTDSEIVKLIEQKSALGAEKLEAILAEKTNHDATMVLCDLLRNEVQEAKI